MRYGAGERHQQMIGRRVPTAPGHEHRIVRCRRSMMHGLLCYAVYFSVLVCYSLSAVRSMCKTVRSLMVTRRACNDRSSGAAAVCHVTTVATGYWLLARASGIILVPVSVSVSFTWLAGAASCYLSFLSSSLKGLHVQRSRPSI